MAFVTRCGLQASSHSEKTYMNTKRAFYMLKRPFHVKTACTATRPRLIVPAQDRVRIPSMHFRTDKRPFLLARALVLDQEGMRFSEF